MTGRRPRLTIAPLMVVILVVAAGLAGLRDPSDLWGSAMYSLAVAALTAGAIAAVAGRGRRRAVWSGFALAGWVYLVLSLDLLNSRPMMRNRPRLFTDVLIEAYHPGTAPSRELFRQVVHPLGAIASGFLGAGFAALIAAEGDAPRPEARPRRPESPTDDPAP